MYEVRRERYGRTGYYPSYLLGWWQARWSLIESIDGLEFV